MSKWDRWARNTLIYPQIHPFRKSSQTLILQVHEEFKQNVENIGVENLIQKFAELKGTGKDKPGRLL